MNGRLLDAEMQEALRREKKARRTLDRERRYFDAALGHERVNPPVKDEFGGRHVSRSAGRQDLMFGMTVLTARPALPREPPI